MKWRYNEMALAIGGPLLHTKVIKTRVLETQQLV